MDKEHPCFPGTEKNIQLIDSNGWTVDLLLPKDENWPDTLKNAFSICLNCGFPSAIYWGEQFKLFYNEEYAEIIGNKHPGAFGQPLAVVYPEIWEALNTQMSCVVESASTMKFTDTPYLLNRYGYLEECYFNYTLSPLFDLEGKVVGIFNIAIESTGKKISQRRSEIIGKFVDQQHFAHALSSCIDECGLILKDALEDVPFHLLYIKAKNNKYKLVSSSGVSQLPDGIKWPIEEMIASGTHLHIKNIADYLPDPVINFFPEPCVEAVIVPLKHEHSLLSGYLVTGVSPRKRLDGEYLEFIQSVSWHLGACFSSASSFDQFVALEEEKDNLLGVISHELKTPITSIKAYSQLALRNLKKDEHQLSGDFLSKMDVQIAKLNQIISDMLDGTNFRSGNILYRKDHFDFDEMVRNTVAVFKENSKHQIILDLNVGQSFNGDQQRLKQVVNNLLSNALKYSAEHSEVKISTVVENGAIQLKIQDQGIGIKQDEQTKIFERFYRSISVKQYTFPGIGLGLFIAKEIVKYFGGKIQVSSEPGYGATFIVTLPL